MGAKNIKIFTEQNFYIFAALKTLILNKFINKILDIMWLTLSFLN
jgi:hypothetical protein